MNEGNKINRKYYDKIQRLEKELEENKEYFDANEENIIKTQKEFKKLSNLKNELDKENGEIKEELNNKKKLIDEYENELNSFKFENETEKQKILIELNDKKTLINKLNTSNNEHT